MEKYPEHTTLGLGLPNGGCCCLFGTLDHGGEHIGYAGVLRFLQPPLELVPHDSDELLLA